MSCYHPLIGIWRGEYTDSGKKKYHIEGNLNPNECPSYLEYIVIPCGRCIGCRLDYSRSWADRMMLELDSAKKAIFVTLTYDNDHAPWSQFDENDIPLYATLDKRDCQLFLKRLRSYYEGVKIRFYLGGEYGEKTLRPHYHAIIFGLGLEDLDNLEKHGKNELGQQYYVSSKLTKIWSKGFVLVSDVSWKTCAYVSRYVTKKLSGDAKISYAERNVIPEFSLMSRKPGIGREYLDRHPDCLDFQSISLTTPEGGLKIRIPKYFLRILVLQDKDKYNKIMNERKTLAEDRMMLKLSETNLSYLEYLEVEEQNKLSSVKALKRDKVR